MQKKQENVQKYKCVCVVHDKTIYMAILKIKKQVEIDRPVVSIRTKRFAAVLTFSVSLSTSVSRVVFALRARVDHRLIVIYRDF